MSKHTAANNPAIAAAKRLYNVPIFRGYSAAWNEGGEPAASAYLLRVVGPNDGPIAGLGRVAARRAVAS